MTTWLDFSWYEKVKGWARKRRKAILWAAAATGAGVCVYCTVCWYRIRVRVRDGDEEEFRLAVAEKEAEDRLEVQLHHHFQSIQSISDSTTLPSVLPQLKDRLFLLVDLSALTERLLAGKDAPQALSPQEKLQLWNRLKILSFTRTISAIAAIALLELFIRIQLNILGRHMYIDTARVLSLGAGSGGELDGNSSLGCQKRFLEFAEFLPHFGIDLLIADIQSAVEKIMSSISLKQRFDPYGLKDLFGQILSSFIDQQVDYLKYVLPTDDVLPGSVDDGGFSLEEVDDENKFKRLMAETRTVLSSIEFHGVLEAILDVLSREAMIDYEAGFSESSTSGMPLAKILPLVANLAGSFLQHVENNHFIVAVASHPKLQSFCAMVYASSS